MAARRNYLNYTTHLGLDLARVAMAGWTPFLLHESGWKPALENWNHPGVDSPFWRLYHNPVTGCHVRCAGIDYQLEPDTLVVIPADTLFDCCAAGTASHLWIHFTTSRPGVVIKRVPQVLPVSPPLRALLQQLITAHEQPAGAERDHGVLHLSCALLHAAFALLQVGPANELPDLMLDVLAHIERMPSTNLSNQHLAERCGMTVERFIRTFSKHTGKTPTAYVTASRVRLAERLLALTDKTVDQVAAECGFANRHYFSRVFAKQAGCGPAEFRKRQGEKKGR
jgi:AraC family transcriptional regulator, arabinose operon regulatory protein